MPRPSRLDIPGQPQHLIVRGNNRSNLFQSEADRMVFLRYLEEALDVSSSEVHAFVLMSNHVHLLATGLQDHSLSRLVQAVGRRYARYVNRNYKRTGTLFEGRFRSSLVDSEEYFLTCMRYIELNPVRAGLARHAAAFKWSSHLQNRTGDPQWMIKPHERYLRLGSTARSRGVAYRALFETAIEDCDLARIRFASAKGIVLGSPDFEREVEQRLERPVSWSPPGRPRTKGISGPECRET